MTTRLALFLVLAACTAGDDPPELRPEAPAGKGDGFCPGVFAGIDVTTPAPFSCGAMDPVSNAQLTDVNAFWGSQTGMCACGPDYPNECAGAFAHTGGWIYADRGFMEALRSSSGSDMTTAYVLAHEFGHEIQGVFGVPAIEQVKELQADCLAGYYLGSLACRDLVSVDDIRITLATACVIADGTGDPVGDLQTHGTCAQRAGMVARGADGYLAGQDALVVCRP